MSTTPPLEPRLQIGRAALTYDSTSNNLHITDADGAPIALDLTGSFKVGGEAVLTTGDVTQEGISPDAATLDGYDSTEFGLKASAEAVTGVWNFVNGVQAGGADVVTTTTLEPALATADVDAATLDGLDSTQFVTTTDTIDADTLDGIDSTGFVKPTDTIDADTLGGTAAVDVGVLSEAESATGIWNFTNGLQVQDADVLTTADASSFLSSSADVTPSVSDDGLTMVDDPTDINFGANLAVTDDGDGTVTIAASGGGTGGDAATLDGYDSTAFWRKAENVNASTLDSLDSDQFLRADVDTTLQGDLTLAPTGATLQIGTAGGPNTLTFGDETAGDELSVVYRTNPNTLNIEDSTNTVLWQWDETGGPPTVGTTDAVLTQSDAGHGNGLDADTVDGHHVFVQATEPANPAEGDLWIDTSAQ